MILTHSIFADEESSFKERLNNVKVERVRITNKDRIKIGTSFSFFTEYKLSNCNFDWKLIKKSKLKDTLIRRIFKNSDKEIYNLFSSLVKLFNKEKDSYYYPRKYSKEIMLFAKK